MVICPVCGRKYSRKIAGCPNCGQQRVTMPAEQTIPDFERWLPLNNLPGNIYAEMVKEVLDNQGIPCFIRSDAISTALGVRTASMPGATAQLFVPEEFHPACRKILLEMMDHI